jgi:hypothetical protein
MSPAYRFHPEFGFFCPTIGFRRKLRVGLAVLVVGGLVGTGGMFAYRAARDHVTNRAMTLARVDEPSSPVHSTSVTEPTAPATADEKPTEKPSAVDSAKTACEQDTWAYLDGRCVASPKARKTRIARPSNEGRNIAAVPLGRPTLPSANSEPIPVVASGGDRQQASAPPPPPPAQAAAAIATEVAPATAPAPPQAHASAPKKAKKVVRRERDRHYDAVARRDVRPREAQLRDQRNGYGGGGFFPFGFMFR